MSSNNHLSPENAGAEQEVFDPVVNVLRALSAPGSIEVSLSSPENYERKNLG